MANVRIEMNSAGVKAVLKSPEVQAELRRRADAMAAAAGEGFEVEESIGAERARAVVITRTFEARLAEAEDRALTRALGAGRG